MNLENLFQIVTLIVTLVLGYVAKKHKYISDNLIPIQNIAIGVISFLVYWFVTKDLNATIIAIPLFSGGAYDVFNNLKKLKVEK